MAAAAWQRWRRSVAAAGRGNGSGRVKVEVEAAAGRWHEVTRRALGPVDAQYCKLQYISAFLTYDPHAGMRKNALFAADQPRSTNLTVPPAQHDGRRTLFSYAQ